MSVLKKIEFDRSQLEKAGKRWLIGIDEVGWGSFAGDFYLGAVAISLDVLNKNEIPSDYLLSQVDDSKIIKGKIRPNLASHIQKKFITAFGKASIEMINKDGMTAAYKHAFESVCQTMYEKIYATLDTDSDADALVLLDGNKPVANTDWDHQAVVKGDSQSFVIGCASIIAKVHRDNIMVELAKQHPHYGWEKNKGYGSAAHREGIDKYGVCEHHRLKFVATYQKNKY